MKRFHLVDHDVTNEPYRLYMHGWLCTKGLLTLWVHLHLGQGKLTVRDLDKVRTLNAVQYDRS